MNEGWEEGVRREPKTLVNQFFLLDFLFCFSCRSLLWARILSHTFGNQRSLLCPRMWYPCLLVRENDFRKMCYKATGVITIHLVSHIKNKYIAVCCWISWQEPSPNSGWCLVPLCKSVGLHWDISIAFVNEFWQNPS